MEKFKAPIITFFLYLGVTRFRKMQKTFADLI
jgi:hypothetical protein